MNTTPILTTDDVRRHVIEAQCHRWLEALSQARTRGDAELARRCAAMANFWLMYFEETVGESRLLDDRACVCAGEGISRIVEGSQPT